MILTLPETTLATFTIPQVKDIGSAFPTNPRKPAWKKRTAKDIKYLVIHHSASTGTLQSENRYHTDPAPKGNDWYKLSYHISIDRGGIYQINDLLDVTPHALGANANGIGICVNWDLRLRGLTDFEKNALYALIITLKAMFPGVEVVGHNEISMRLAGHSTQCPVISMKKFRDDLTAVENEIAFNNSKQKKDEIVFRISNALTYYINLANGKNPDGTPAVQGNKDFGGLQLAKLEPEMRRLGMLK